MGGEVEYDWDFDDRPEPEGEDMVYAEAAEAWHRHQARTVLLRLLVELSWIHGRMWTWWVNARSWRRYRRDRLAECAAGEHQPMCPVADDVDGSGCAYLQPPF